jgi:hypothetical protein
MKLSISTWAILFVSVLLGGCSTCLESANARKIPHFDESILDVVIPHIEWGYVPIEQAVQILHDKWQEQLHDRRVPAIVVLGDFHSGRMTEQTNSPSSTDPFQSRYTDHAIAPGVHANSISVRDCFTLLADATGHRFSIRSGMVRLEPIPAEIIEGFGTFRFNVPPSAEKFLHLNDKTTSKELTDLLRTYGIRFEDGFSAAWEPGTKQIVFTTYISEPQRIDLLFSLIDGGFEIKKTQQGGGEERR